jgi:MOSC domain-containing protein YiiM
MRRRPGIGQDAGVDNRVGTVASLHLHPEVAGQPLRSVAEVCAEAGQGIVGDARVFGRRGGTGKISLRQVSLIGREEIERHAVALGLPGIAPGAVRSNIETSGIELAPFVGCEMEVGEAVLLFYAVRTPCHKMDCIAPGLQALMSQGRQGVMAQIVRSGTIRVGDKIQRKV